MLLEDKVAVVYGAGGAVGSAVAQVLAREGAEVFLAGRTRVKLDRAAEAVEASGRRRAQVATVDALDEDDVGRHLDSVLNVAGRVDISVNAVGFDNGEQGIPLTDLTADDYCRPIAEYTRTHFVTAKAAGRQMVAQRRGVIIALSNPMAKAPAALSGCFGQYAAAVEGLATQLAAELGPDGVRSLCLRPTGMPASALEHDSAPGRMWRRAAERFGIGIDELLETIGGGTLSGEPVSTGDVAEAAAFVASDRAKGLTGTVINVTGGAVAD
ncbi:SDR family NAD(P)-dependent oxidoreductase [Ruania zhangjianzhongii]|uniref:SDR family NAD(P)-dependent oxidoreductase n=1 Tax=Ruania zhangjianzhongii TaxID=2603206 RepID=UPI0011C82FAF|nr:SDR family oxidoreductase [Ruania zhangjianzhongii]